MGNVPSRFTNGIDEWESSRGLFKVAFGRAEPQRHMCWLHCLLNHRRQLCAELVQIHLIADGRTECSDRFGCVILATVEATVDLRTGAIMQGLEQASNQKRGSDNRQLVSPDERETTA